MYFKNIYFFHFIFIEYVHAIYICIIKLYNWYIKYYAIAFLRVIHVYSYGSEFLYTLLHSLHKFGHYYICIFVNAYGWCIPTDASSF